MSLYIELGDDDQFDSQEEGMSMEPRLAAHFVPRRLLRHLKRSTGGASTPRADAIANTAMLLVEVSGLKTALEEDTTGPTSEGVTQAPRAAPAPAPGGGGGGWRGDDNLTELLDDVLGGVERAAWELGGSMVHVSGNTVCCVFLPPHGTQADSEIAVALAEECARRVILEFSRVACDPNVSVRGAVAHGELTVIRLGGGRGGGGGGDGRGAGGEAPSTSCAANPKHHPNGRHSSKARRRRQRQLTVAGQVHARAAELLRAAKRGEVLLYRGYVLPADSLTLELLQVHEVGLVRVESS
jgi:hypothetical protein